jgi:predicted RNA-binding protein with PIN domain
MEEERVTEAGSTDKRIDELVGEVHRFEGKVEHRFQQFESKVEHRFERLEDKIDTRFAKWDKVVIGGGVSIIGAVVSIAGAVVYKVLGL